mmetsp:Transcript_35101/g.116337  ORF Transcript_35101/g.116337 Transcript_35101/m.116337 type:complete len:348 (-) Transcript_35101:74-1117(-)
MHISAVSISPGQLVGSSCTMGGPSAAAAFSSNARAKVRAAPRERMMRNVTKRARRMLPTPVMDCRLPMTEGPSPSPPAPALRDLGVDSHTGITSVRPTFVRVKMRHESCTSQKKVRRDCSSAAADASSRSGSSRTLLGVASRLSEKRSARVADGESEWRSARLTAHTGLPGEERTGGVAPPQERSSSSVTISEARDACPVIASSSDPLPRRWSSTGLAARDEPRELPKPPPPLPAPRPPPLPPHWHEARDPSSGAVYYYNDQSSATTWHRPGPQALGQAAGAPSSRPSSARAGGRRPGSARTRAPEARPTTADASLGPRTRVGGGRPPPAPRPRTAISPREYTFGRG